MLFNLKFIFSEFFLLLIFLLSLCFYTYLQKYNLNKTIQFHTLSVYNSVSIYFYLSYIFYFFFKIKYINIIYFTFNFSFTNFGIIESLKIILILFFLIILFCYKNYFTLNKQIPVEFLYIINLSFIGILMLLHINDFLLLFLTIELQSFGIYILIGIQRTKY